MRPLPNQTIPDSIDDINSARLNGLHDWHKEGYLVPSFQMWVVSPSMWLKGQFRDDLIRYSHNCTVNRQATRQIWDQEFRLRGRIFLIPPTVLLVNRSFVRDVQDVYYIEAMETYLHRANLLPIQYNPILLSPMLPRWYVSYDKRPLFITEQVSRNQLRRFVSAEDKSTTFIPPQVVLRDCAEVPAWYSNEAFPTLLFMPNPPSTYYYEKAFRDNRLRAVVQHLLDQDICLLAVSCWWNMATFSGRGIIMPRRTLEILRRMVPPHIEVTTSVSCGYILTKMELCSDLSIVLPQNYNTVRFNNPAILDSQYVDVRRTDGSVIMDSPGGLSIDYTKLGSDIGSLRRAHLRQRSASTSALAQYMTFEELQKFPGLHQLMHREGLITRRGIRVEYALGVLNRELHNTRRY